MSASDQVPSSKETFSLGGQRITVSSSGYGPPLLLIHGLSGSARWWRQTLPALQGQRAYAVNLAGFGEAGGQRQLGVRASAALLGEWLRYHNLSDVVVVGHSMGGHISLHLASAHPERLRGLVLVSASGLLRGEWWKLAMTLPRAALSGKRRFVPTVVADGFRAGVFNLHRATRDLLHDDVGELLPGIGMPTLVVWGGQDNIVPPQLGRALADAIPGAQLVMLPRAAHVPMVDDPEGFQRALSGFLAGLPPLPGQAASSGDA